MKRYQYTKKEKNKFGEQVYKTTLYPHIKKNEDDLYIRTVDGDRLDKLAHKYYKNSDLWWIIAQANHIGKGTMNIEPGIQIRIPSDLQVIDAMLEKRNLRG